MAYHFERDESPGDAARRVATEEIDGALTALGWQDADLAVHDVRKRFKKLKALARLLSAGGDRYPAAIRGYRDAARTIAEARDAKVMLATATWLEAGPQVAAVLGERLEAIHDRSLRGALDALAPTLVQMRDDVGSWLLEDLTLADVHRALRRTYRRGRRRQRHAAEVQTVEALHQWRKRVKDAWYHLRLLASPDGTVAAFDRLADDLGRDHDLAVLAAFLLDHGIGADVLPRIEVTRRELRERALGSDLYRRPPEAFEAWIRS